MIPSDICVSIGSELHSAHASMIALNAFINACHIVQ